MKNLKVENNYGIRLDKFLSEYKELDLSRTLISKMIDDEFILVNDKKVKSNYTVKENDNILIKDNYLKDMDVEPQKMNLNIVYEDDDIIVIDKPSGLVVHPGSGNYSNTLVNGLMYHTDELSDINGELRPGIVHRIDKDTSGLMLVTKTNKAHEILSDDFKNKKVKREYVALVDGVFPHASATIDAPIGRDTSDRKKMTVTSNNSKKAITNLKVIERYKDYTLLSLILETGRTHQIRVHMSYIGYPVHNDPVYGNKLSDSFGQFLHSAKITFIHPTSKKEMTFSSPLPKEFQVFLEKIDK